MVREIPEQEIIVTWGVPGVNAWDERIINVCVKMWLVKENVYFILERSKFFDINGLI